MPRNASNVFTVLELNHLTRTEKIRITLNLPGPGTVLAVARAATLFPLASTPTRKKQSAKQLVVARQHFTLHTPGEIVITLTPTATARAILRKLRKLEAKLVITYTPNGDQPKSTGRYVVFWPKRAKKEPKVTSLWR
jgi:hypothetical protein